MESKSLHSQEKKLDFWLSEAGAKDDGGAGLRVLKGTKFQLQDKQALSTMHSLMTIISNATLYS